MKVNALQHDIVWGNPAENRQHLEQLIKAAPESDLYVMPEMWSTGFATDPNGLAEKDGASLQWMKQMAQRYDAALAGSVAVEEDGRYYNRLYFVKPNGVVEYYDKHHLFSYGGEDKHYACGNKRVVVEWRGVRFLLAVCYDLRFPVWTRYCGDYDAIIIVANWPTVRIDSWNILLRARAIENQCYVVGVNRVGKDPNCEYCGCSAIINPYGQTMVECERDKECSAETVLDMQMLETYRAKFPALKEKDKFEITI